MIAVSLKHLTNTFVPFGLAIVVPVMAAELTRNLDYSRSVYTMWVSIAFAVPAACILAVTGRAGAWSDYRLMLWTFGFVAYVGHVYYSSVVSFSADLRAIHADHGVTIAVAKIVIGAWWAAGLALEWSSLSQRRWARANGLAAQVAVLGVFFTSAVVLRDGLDRGLGIAVTVVVVACVVARIVSEWHRSLDQRTTV